MLAALLALPVVAASPAFWQSADSPVHSLFRRQANPSDPNFASHYPPQLKAPNATDIPQAWLDKLKTVKLPNNPISTKEGCCTIKYPDHDPMGEDICSNTAGCKNPKYDIWNGPDGVFVLTFDDGPTEVSQQLYDFLSQNKIGKAATHFMIGGNIAADPLTAEAAFKNGGLMAVHTWSHQYTTSLTNEQVVGEIGWTMQAIADVTGGRIPTFWRPPYGDVDNRVRVIAKEVFGLTTVLWNKDTNDWAIGTKDITVDTVKETMEGWFKGPKSPGIVALEHETTNDTLAAFTAQFSHIQENGWKLQSVGEAFGMEWYQNAHGNDDQIYSTMSVGQINTASFTNQTQATPTASSNTTSGAPNATITNPSSLPKSSDNSSAERLAVPCVAAFLAAAIALF